MRKPTAQEEAADRIVLMLLVAALAYMAVPFLSRDPARRSGPPKSSTYPEQCIEVRPLPTLGGLSREHIERPCTERELAERETRGP